jgi:protein-S-isoprenylcysteine O-methyltransferase Ste14
MLFLRIILFLGMAFHKLVWEVMKKGSSDQKTTQISKPTGLKAIIKFLKAAALVFLIIQTLILDIFPIMENPFTIRLIGILLYLLGLTIAVVGRVQLGNNWANLEDYQVLPDQSLVQRGIYGYIRHPIYLGDILLILGLELALNSWLVIGVIPLIIIVLRQTQEEENILQDAFPEYNNYRKQTKMFIPFII